jgi:hypothetical protein
MLRWRAVVVMTAIAVFVGFSACGDDDEAPAGTATTETSGVDVTDAAEGEPVVSNTVEVTITEDALEPSNVDPESLAVGETVTSTASAGEVTFELTNEASEPKSVVFNQLGKEIPLAKKLAPGESTSATVDVTSGYYVYYDADTGPEGAKAQLHVVD